RGSADRIVRVQPPNFQQLSYQRQRTSKLLFRRSRRRLGSWDRIASLRLLHRRASRGPLLLLILLLFPIDTPEVVLPVQVIFAAVKGLPDVLHATGDCLHSSIRIRRVLNDREDVRLRFLFG
ncbi:unnamed protein product, partial [Callosobruchus maculatus]